MDLTKTHSSHDFVKSLKSASDPPLVGGPSKIEISQQAWEDASFYVPSIAEVIVDWILAKFLKDKGKEIAFNPVFDKRYWRLLLELVTTPQKGATESRSIKSWLAPLLHRMPVGPAVVVFLTSFVHVHEEEREQLSEFASSCLIILWPLAVQKMNSELVLECFGALLGFLFSNPLDAGFAKHGRLVVNSYRNSLNNSFNKKKLLQTFLQSHLCNWLHAVAKDFGIHESLKNDIVDAGIDTIFNLGILRQSQDGNVESALLQNLRTLNNSQGELVMETLPKIYDHYIYSLKKHRGALFGQGSQHCGETALDELHGAGVRFFMSCEGMLCDHDQTSPVWATRIAIMQIANRENLFHRKQSDTQVVLDQILNTSLTALNDSWQVTHSQTTALALKCLSMLVHDDFDLVVPALPHILVRILQIQEYHEHHLHFLVTLLDYYIKTRTLNNLIECLFKSIISKRPPCPISGQERYQIECSSAIMNPEHLSRLSKALRNSLTASQCLPTVEYVVGTLKNLWERYYTLSRNHEGDAAEGAMKKRKTSTTAVANDSNMKELAVTYCLVANLTSVVLSSLPVQSLPSDILEELRAFIVDFRMEFVHHTISKALKVLKKQGDIDAWSTEVVLASTLRLLYALDTSKYPSLPLNQITKLFENLADLSGNNELLPELTLELFRVLLGASSRDDPQRVKDLMEQLLKYVESHFYPADVHWSGQAHHLTKVVPGRAKCALAIMHMIFERWLPVIDQSASSQQLERLLDVVVGIDVSRMTPTEKYLQPEQFFLQALHSALFWELGNIRNVLLNIIDKKTAPLEGTVIDQAELSSIFEKVATYRLLLLFPVEYFPGKNLSALIGRAMSLDDLLNALPFAQNIAIPRALAVIRVFLKRAHLQGASPITQDSGDQVSLCILKLLKEQDGIDPSIVGEFSRATLDLTEIYFSKLLKSSKNGDSKALLNALALYDQTTFDTFLCTRAQSFIEFIDLLTREFPVESLPDDITTVIRDLHGNLSSSLFPRVVLRSDRHKDDDVFQLIDLMSGWYRLLCLGGWLRSTIISAPIPLIGKKMILQLMSSCESDTGLQKETMDNLKVLAFAVILQELGHRPEQERPSHMDFILAVYISFYDAIGASSRNQLDVHFGRSCRGMSLTDFAYLLSFVSDSLSDIRCLPTSQLICLVHLSASLLREHPSHTLVHIQKFATRSINGFAGRNIFVHGPLRLRLQVLDLLVQHCSDQQAALRSTDAAAIWLFISKMLAPSQVHDQDTEVMVFHKIIAISSSLIRLRRDLVTCTLPHIGMVLRQLLLSTRGCRSNLGAKQKTLVMNTQPQWINASRPLGAEEGKALGRLLESLNTKTIVRTLSSSTSDSQKAESLTKPFSKHAAYVLQAYIEAMNDSLCVLSSEVRKQLEPGLFALCAMMNEYGRDALMVSALDAGGKATLKALWKEYEKQRYVGKG